MKSDPFIVRLIDNDVDKKTALEFIEKIAMERHGSKPPPPPQMLFGAYRNGKIVGTISLDFGSDASPLPLEKIWEFDKENSPLPFERSRIAQYGRWTAIVPGVSVALFYAATVFSKTHKKQFCLFEMKKPIAGRLTQLGFILMPFKKSHLVVENVSEEGRRYYREQPQPRLYMVNLDQTEQAMQNYILSITSLSLTFSSTI